MVGRQAEVALAMLDDGNRETLGEFGERRDRCAVAAGIGGDDERVLRRREEARRHGERRLVRRRC